MIYYVFIAALIAFNLFFLGLVRADHDWIYRIRFIDRLPGMIGRRATRWVVGAISVVCLYLSIKLLLRR